MNILIADDNLACREYLSALFKQLPEHPITLEEVGREAWTLLDGPKRWFDVALIDLNMPHRSGLELLQRLHDSPCISR